jgi:hypothetical protein
LPITVDQAKNLKDPTVSFKTNDDVFTNIYQIESRDIKIKNPAWPSSLRLFLNPLASRLGLKPSDLSAELDSLLFMERGSNIEWCSNIDDQKKMVGTLLIQLPSKFSGGLFRVCSDEEGGEESMSSFGLGQSTSESQYGCHFLCHYNDVQYEMKPIKSGCRILLKYALIYDGRGSIPSSRVLLRSVVPLRTSLDSLPRADRIVIAPFGRRYSSTILAQKGVNALDYDHRAMVEAIKVAGKRWKVLIVQARKSYSTCDRRYDDGDDTAWSTSHLEVVYSQEGHEVASETMEWLRKVVCFAPIAEAVRVGGWDRGYEDIDGQNRSCIFRDAMMLTDSKMVNDNWGPQTSQSQRENEFEECIYTSKFHATFLLAYDQGSNFELQCICGVDSVSAAITELIVPTQDYDMLERLLDVIEAKKQCEMESKSSTDLLQMMLLSTDDIRSLVVPFVNRVLLCSPSKEPASAHWEVITLLVKKFGWASISESVRKLLYDDDRKRNHLGKSRITLPIFLNRVEFILKLKEIEGQDLHSFTEQCIAGCIVDFENTDNTSWLSRIGINEAINKLDTIIARYGWDENLLRSTLAYLTRNTNSKLADDLSTLIDMGAFILKLLSINDCDFIQGIVSSFTRKFSCGGSASSFSYELDDIMIGNERCTNFLRCIHTVIKYGSDEETKALGEKMIYRKANLTSVLKAFRENRSNEIDSQALIRDFTNRCLVQHSIKFVTSEERSFFSSSGWYIEEDGSHDSFSMTLLGVDASEGNSSPSAHIQMVFKAYPNLAMLRDECGRLPLHWASSSGDASYDTYDTVSFILKKNPAAASARDPISGLFPFMLAASVSNEAAFELLLASPNLVASGVKSASDDGLAFKKRKMVPT